jgi:preprotein translocase subunit SecE
MKTETKQNISVHNLSSILIASGSFWLFITNPYLLPSLYSVLILLAGLILGGFVFFSGSTGSTFFSFIKETKIELKKVVWPSNNDIVNTTIHVSVAVIAMATFLWGVDSAFRYLIKTIFLN